MTGVQSTLVSPDGRMLAFIVSVDEDNTIFLGRARWAHRCHQRLSSDAVRHSGQGQRWLKELGL
jgi:hypothetical protein